MNLKYLLNIHIFNVLCNAYIVSSGQTPSRSHQNVPFIAVDALKPIFDDPEASVKQVAISQYPYPRLRWREVEPHMGYTYRSRRYRYTVWIQKDFQHGETDGPIAARELYDYENDPLETVNYIDNPAYADVVKRFERIHAMGWKAALSVTPTDW